MRNLTNNIVFNKFVRLVEENHQNIIEHFMNDVLKNDKTIAFRNFGQQALYEIGVRICRELSNWVTKDLSKEKVQDYYVKIGRERFVQGIPSSQVFQALVILKRHMWLFIRRRLENDIEDYSQALHLNDRIVLFFDRATHALLQGYDDELERRF